MNQSNVNKTLTKRKVNNDDKKKKRKLVHICLKVRLAYVFIQHIEQRNTTELNKKICLNVLCYASFARVHKKKLFV